MAGPCAVLPIFLARRRLLPERNSTERKWRPEAPFLSCDLYAGLADFLRPYLTVMNHTLPESFFQKGKLPFPITVRKAYTSDESIYLACHRVVHKYRFYPGQ